MMIPKPNRGRAGSALHNFGHSFVSLINVEGDYVMSILVRTAERTGLHWFAFDVLGDRVEPLSLATAPVRRSVTHYRGEFPRLLQSHRVPFDDVDSADLRLEFDFDRVRPSESITGRSVVPFVCTVTMRDLRGRTYVGRVEKAWLMDR
jgi:hypothetical protein